MLSNSLRLLLAGFTMGWGPCLIFTTPLLLPYIGATKRNWQGGLKIGLAFSIGRLLALAILGGLALVFLTCALVGLIPESGPYMVFVVMFANGIVPFSILLTSSIVQDGHGMLPLFSYSVKDALMIKIFNFVFTIAIGLPLLLLGW